MGSTNEEITARMAMDTTPFSQAITKSKSQMKEFSESGRSGFVHAEEAGRSFHKMMKSIEEQSPVMGRALGFALSPVAGIFSAATVGAKLLMDQLDVLIKAFDQVSKNMASSLGDAPAALKKTREQMEAERNEFTKFSEGLAPSPSKEIAAKTLPGDEAKSIALVDKARDKVAGQLLDYQSGTSSKQKENRRNTINRAQEDIKKLEEAIAKEEAIKAQFEEFHQTMEDAKNATGISGIGAKVSAGFQAGITGRERLQLYNNAASNVDKFKAALTKRRSLVDTLSKADASASESNKDKMADLKDLESTRSQLLTGLHGTVSKGADTSMRQTEQALNTMLQLLGTQGIKIQLPDN